MVDQYLGHTNIYIHSVFGGRHGQISDAECVSGGGQYADNAFMAASNTALQDHVGKVCSKCRQSTLSINSYMSDLNPIKVSHSKNTLL